MPSPSDCESIASSGRTLWKFHPPKKRMRLVALNHKETTQYMIEKKMEDILNYKNIAIHAWDLECDLWDRFNASMTCRESMEKLMESNKINMPKVKCMSGKYRWLAWRSQKGIRAKRHILRMHAQRKKEAASMERDLAMLFMNDDRRMN